MYIIKMELSRTIYYQAGMNTNRERNNHKYMKNVGIKLPRNEDEYNKLQ